MALSVASNKTRRLRKETFTVLTISSKETCHKPDQVVVPVGTTRFQHASSALIRGRPPPMGSGKPPPMGSKGFPHEIANGHDKRAGNLAFRKAHDCGRENLVFDRARSMPRRVRQRTIAARRNLGASSHDRSPHRGQGRTHEGAH